MSCKALGIAIKLTLQGDNQLFHPATSVFGAVVTCCVLTQISYLNRVSTPPQARSYPHPLWPATLAISHSANRRLAIHI